MEIFLKEKTLTQTRIKGKISEKVKESAQQPMIKYERMNDR